MTNVPPPIDYAHPYVAPRKSAWRSVLGWGTFILLAILFFIFIAGDSRRPRNTLIRVTDFETLLKSGAISSITIDGDEVFGMLATPQTLPTTGNISSFRVSFP